MLAGVDQNEDMVKTVEAVKTRFTLRQISDTTKLRKFQNNAGLTNRAMLRVIDNKMLNNFPFTRESAKHAMSIWGPSIPNLRGKTTRAKADMVPLGGSSWD